jgi:hypothetical protein
MSIVLAFRLALSAALAAVPRPHLPADLACITMNTKNLPLATRQSPLDSVSFTVGGKAAKVCYGRPSLRGRKMLGGEAVPYGKLWRTGANEPTMIHTSGPLAIAGIKVPAGSYSLYTVPGPSDWVIIVNRSITQWGEESNYTDKVKGQEVGRANVKAESAAAPVEKFTIRAEPPGSDATALLLEWQTTRVRIPLSR